MTPNDGPPPVTREVLIVLRRSLIVQVNHLSDVLGLPHVRPARDDGNGNVNGPDALSLDTRDGPCYTDRDVL